jgi:hypothetical protein
MATAGEARGAEEIWRGAIDASHDGVGFGPPRARAVLFAAAVLVIAGGAVAWTIAAGTGTTTTESTPADQATTATTPSAATSTSPSSTTGAAAPGEADTTAESRTTVAFPSSGEDPASGPPDAADVIFDEELSATYTRCVNDLAGRELIEGAGVFTEVFTDANGVPSFVKTAIDVPAEYHVPCFTEIGGRPHPDDSSWG